MKAAAARSATLVSVAFKQPFVSYAEYARQEIDAEERHEWHDGIVVEVPPKHAAALGARG